MANYSVLLTMLCAGLMACGTPAPTDVSPENSEDTTDTTATDDSSETQDQTEASDSTSTDVSSTDSQDSTDDETSTSEDVTTDATSPDALPAFSLVDSNTRSATFNQPIATADYAGGISAWYFTHAT